MAKSFRDLYDDDICAITSDYWRKKKALDTDLMNSYLDLFVRNADGKVFACDTYWGKARPCVFVGISDGEDGAHLAIMRDTMTGKEYKLCGQNLFDAEIIEPIA